MWEKDLSTGSGFKADVEASLLFLSLTLMGTISRFVHAQYLQTQRKIRPRSEKLALSFLNHVAKVHRLIAGRTF